MEFNQWHFSHPDWLWAALVIPLVWVFYFLFFKPKHPLKHLDKFIDKHLLPYLLVGKKEISKNQWNKLLIWSLVWGALTIALAGPSWSYREIDVSSKDQSLVILLDLSESMNTQDIKPSRLIRAKQKIEDLINLSKGVKLGLIAFAADPHMISPITDDKETLRHLLPSLDTDLVYIQGSRLSSALEMASGMLEAEPGTNKAILIMTDGDFEDGSAITTVKKLADKGIAIHVLGLGTVEGALLQDKKGLAIKKNGSPILSRLEKNKLLDLVQIGKGRYLEGSYSDHGEKEILKDLEKHAEAIFKDKKMTLWDERFYLFILPILPFMLWWFRKGAVLFLFVLMPTLSLQAGTLDAYFLNKNELGLEAFNEGEYEEAVEIFSDSYRKGVAYYKAGNYAQAEKMFRESTRQEVASDAEYNLGNTLVQEKKLKEARTVYENLLKKWPDHQKAKDNLELVKKMLKQEQEQQQQQKQDPSSSDQSENQDQKKDSEQKDQQQNQDPDSENSEDSQKDQQDKSSKPEDQQKENSSDKPGPQQDPQDPQPDLDQNKESEEQEEQVISPPEKQDKSQEASEDQAKETQSEEIPEMNAAASQEATADEKAQGDEAADFWLNRLQSNPKTFLKNKFYIESKQNGTTKGIDPW